jgi:NAD-dependent DNA ligase OB-fold domain/NAD-dependent DNA ligase adenylation domain
MISKALTQFATSFRAHPRNTLRSLDAKEAEELVRLARRAYHDTPPTSPLTDAEYDLLEQHLRSLAPDSKVLREVGAPEDAAPVMRLPFHMGSLTKVPDVEAWLASSGGARAAKLLLLVADKLDGMSALLWTRGGTGGQPALLSRGDGTNGRDVTGSLKHLANGPAVCASLRSLGQGVAVRGELIIPRSEAVKNARNVVVGAVGATRKDATVLNKVRFVAYEMCPSYPEDAPRATASVQYRALQMVGFEVAWHRRAEPPPATDRRSLSLLLAERRATSPYEVDGLVLSRDVVYSPAEASASGNPVHAVAFKAVETQQTAETTVLGVEWKMSSRGVRVPTVVFEPVDLGGAVVRRATGHNAQHLLKRGIGPGAVILVRRAGDVIPIVHEVLKPAAVPSVPSEGDQDPDGAEEGLARLKNFFQKLGVRDLGPGKVAALYEAGLTTVGQVMAASPQHLADRVRGFALPTATKLLRAIREAVVGADVGLLMAASGCFTGQLGEKRLRILGGALQESGVEGARAKVDAAAAGGIGKGGVDSFLADLPGYVSFAKGNGLDPFRRRAQARHAEAL